MSPKGSPGVLQAGRSAKLILLILPLMFFCAGQAIAAVSGQQLWVKKYGSPSGKNDVVVGLGVDRNNNIFAVGPSAGDYMTIKYDSAGRKRWVRRYDSGGGATDRAVGTAVASGGGVYVYGTSRLNKGPGDMLTIKYGPAGDLLWAARYGSLNNGNDYATAIAKDAKDNIVVAGFSAGDYLIIKYGPKGKRHWVRRYNPKTNLDDVPAALAVDKYGNVYVTGRSRAGSTADDILTLKYDALGNRKWIRRHAEPGSSNDRAAGIVVRDSDVYITGSSGSKVRQEFLTLKYDAAGSKKWVKRFAGTGARGGSGVDIALDGNRNLYVSGTTDNGTTATPNYDFTALSYDQSGNQRWVRHSDGGTAESVDAALRVAVDRSGQVIFSGVGKFAGSANPTFDALTIKYDALGNKKWARRYRTKIGLVMPGALAFDGANSVYVAGSSYNSNYDNDFFVVKYAP